MSLLYSILFFFQLDHIRREASSFHHQTSKPALILFQTTDSFSWSINVALKQFLYESNVSILSMIDWKDLLEPFHAYLLSSSPLDLRILHFRRFPCSGMVLGVCDLDVVQAHLQLLQLVYDHQWYRHSFLFPLSSFLPWCYLATRIYLKVTFIW